MRHSLHEPQYVAIFLDHRRVSREAADGHHQSRLIRLAQHLRFDTIGFVHAEPGLQPLGMSALDFIARRDDEHVGQRCNSGRDRWKNFTASAKSLIDQHTGDLLLNDRFGRRTAEFYLRANGITLVRVPPFVLRILDDASA
jgi:hypothetical protein